jgi:hypothetical protein
MDPHAKQPYTSSTIVNPNPTVVPSTQPVDLLIPAAPIETSASRLKRVSWGSIFAGAAFATVLQLWFNLLGLAIGLAAFNPLAESATGLGVGAVIWLIGTTVISLFCGGWLAGRLTGSPSQLDRAIHGVVAWSVASLFGLWIISSGVTRAIAGTASVAGEVAGAAAPAMGPAAGAIKERVEQNLPPEIEQSLQELRADPDLRRSVMNVLGGEGTPQDREELIVQLSEKGDMDRAEAEQKIAGWEQQATAAKYKVADVTETAANTLSAVAFLGALSMFFGLGSAALGGAMAYDSRKGRTTRSKTDVIVTPPRT